MSYYLTVLKYETPRRHKGENSTDISIVAGTGLHQPPTFFITEVIYKTIGNICVMLEGKDVFLPLMY